MTNMINTTNKTNKTYSSNKTYKTNTTNKSNKSYKTYFVLFVLLLSFFPIPKTAEAAALSRPPSNLGLVGYWPMDDGGGAVAGDMSGNGNNGTITGGTWTNGKRGGALSFDGSSSKVIIPNSSSLNISGSAITVSVWFKTSSLSGKKILLNKGSYGYHWNYGIGFNDSNLMFRHNNGDIISTAVSVSLNTWHNFTAVYSGGNDYYYFDGVLVDTKSDGGWAEQTGNKQLTIGAAYTFGTDGYSKLFNGQLDDVRIYNRALTATEISKLYSSGQVIRKQVSNQGLVGYWSFNEGFGTKADDSSGNGNTGTITGATWTDGKRGKALSFDGNSSKVTLPSIQAGTNMSIAAWIKKNTSTGQRSFFSSRSGGTYLGLNGAKIFLYENNATPKGITSSSDVIQIGQWQHIVATSDGSITTFYVNGVQVYQANQTRPGGSGGAGIGWDPEIGTEFWDGIIDEVRVYNRALSATEIANLYKQGETVVNSSQNNKLTNGLVGFWSFNGRDIDWGTNTAYDRSGQGNNGTIGGGMTRNSVVDGKVGQALNYSNYNYINIPDNSTLDISDNISISLWVNPRQITTNHALHPISKWSTTANANFVLYYFGTFGGLGTPSLMFYANNGGNWGNVSASYPNPPLNEWTHVGWTYNSSVGGQLYINGIPYGSKAGSGALATNNIPAYIGSDASDGPIWIDEVRIYNRVLSDTEMKQLYNLGR